MEQRRTHGALRRVYCLSGYVPGELRLTELGRTTDHVEMRVMYYEAVAQGFDYVRVREEWEHSADDA